MLRWFCLQGDEPSQSRIRSTAPPKGELYEWGRESFCFSGEGQPARKMQKSSPIGGAGKAVRLWLRGFFLQGEFFKWQNCISATAQ